MRIWSLVVFFLVAASYAQEFSATDTSAAEAAIKAIHPQAIAAHMRFLSDGLLEGRETGTRGYDTAALYVSAQMESLGLEPGAGRGSWLQAIHLRRATNDGKSKVTLFRDGKEVPLKYDDDYAVYGDLAHTSFTIMAPVVFVGYGIRAPELGYDDYAGVDVRGKIIARWIDAPKQFPPDQRAYYSEPIQKQKVAEALGAVGTLILPLPEEDGSFNRHKSVDVGLLDPRTQGLRAWLDPAGNPSDSFPTMAPLVLLTPSGSKVLFAGSGHTLDEAYKIARAGHTQSFPLSLTATIRGSSRHESLRSENVIGKLTGSDPKLKNEYVVFSAHLDHTGHCKPVNGDDICHGAMDNASGVASVLEIARAFKSLSMPPRRSVLFVFFTGEEGRCEGSDYFLHFPPVPLASIVADINLDIAPGFLSGGNFVKAVGSDHSTMADNVKRATEKSGYTLLPDPSPEGLALINSDQYLFFLAGIPAVYMLDTAGGDPARRRTMDHWYDKVYHTPLDNIDQPFDFERAAKATSVSFLAGYEIAQQDRRTEWNKDDFFGTMFGPRHSIP